MADFTDVLSRAVAGKKTYDERRAVYERARQALVNQLRALDPPLPESDVTRQRLALEEAIRKIEQEASSLAAAARAAALRRQSEAPSAGPAVKANPAASAPAAAILPKAPDITPGEALALRPRTPEPAPASDLFVRVPPSMPPMPGAGPKSEPATASELSAEPRRTMRADQGTEPGDGGDPLVAHYEPHLRQVSSGAPAWRRLIMIGLIILALGVAGAGGVILALRSQQGGGDTPVPPPADGPPVKSIDRVGQPAAAPAPAPQASAPQSGVAPTNTKTPVAVLYDENAQNAGGVDSYKGSVTWRVDSDSGAQGPERVIRGLIDIPERGLKVLLTIRRNLDQALPASHTVELLFDVPPNFVYGGVESLEQVFMKSAEQANGLPLRGALARITSGYFLIGLSALGPNRENNIGLLRDRPWIDITFLYRSGRRAVLAVGKGEQGEKIFQDVFTQWGG